MNIHRLASYLVPEQRDRIPITPITFLYLFVPLILLLPLGYLVRRPNTRLLRLALFPFPFISSIRAAYAYNWSNPLLNYCTTAAGLFYAGKALEWGFSPRGVLKLGETEPGSIKTPAVFLRAGVERPKRTSASNGVVYPCDEDRKLLTEQASLLGGIRESVEVMFAARGLGWEFGSGTRLFIPEETRDTSNRSRFLLQTLRTVVVKCLIWDFIDSIFKTIPGVGSASGVSIYAFGSNSFEKYLIATVIHLLALCCMLTGFDLIYDIITIIAVAVLRHNPVSWPPAQLSVWTGLTLREMWAKKWHQFLRQTILVFGGYPLQKIFGVPGLVIGTFLASGYFHIWTFYGVGRDIDNGIFLFFVLNGVGMLAERTLQNLVGRKYGRLVGQICGAFFLIVVAQIYMNVNIKHGLAGGTMFPAAISPTHRILFPIVEPLVKRFL